MDNPFRYGGVVRGRYFADRKNEIKELKRDLRKKEKALAETAALLVLGKKMNAIWGEGEDE